MELDRRCLIATGLAAPLIAAVPAPTGHEASPRRRERLADGWRFHLGHAADPARDFGWGARSAQLRQGGVQHRHCGRAGLHGRRLAGGAGAARLGSGPALRHRHRQSYAQGRRSARGARLQGDRPRLSGEQRWLVPPPDRHPARGPDARCMARVRRRVSRRDRVRERLCRTPQRERLRAVPGRDRRLPRLFGRAEPAGAARRREPGRGLVLRRRWHLSPHRAGQRRARSRAAMGRGGATIGGWRSRHRGDRGAGRQCHPGPCLHQRAPHDRGARRQSCRKPGRRQCRASAAGHHDAVRRGAVPLATALVGRVPGVVHAGDRGGCGRGGGRPCRNALRHPHHRFFRDGRVPAQRPAGEAARHLQPPGPCRRRHRHPRCAARLAGAPAAGHGIERLAQRAQHAVAGAGSMCAMPRA